MMSFGESSKAGIRGTAEEQQQIGRYGIGCKSGCMRLAEDVIVFSKHETKDAKGVKFVLYSIALLSRNYLRLSSAEEVFTFSL